MKLRNYIADVPDFPEPWILFRDITPLLSSPEAFSYCIKILSENLKNADVILGLDARGFIFASAVALRLKKPLILVRKSGKLPRETFSESYTLEYGKNTFEIHKDSISSWQKVALIDDLLATGGSMSAACNLVKKSWGEIHSVNFVIELAFLEWAKLLETYERRSLIVYN